MNIRPCTVYTNTQELNHITSPTMTNDRTFLSSVTISIVAIYSLSSTGFFKTKQ